MEQEKKKSNKKIFIIIGIIVIVAVIIGLVITLNNQRGQNNDIKDTNVSNKSNNDIINKENHEYGNTDEHNSNQGRIATDDEYLYFAGERGITKQAKKDILQSNTSTKIFTTSSLYLNLYEDYIYFLNMENKNIYRIDKTGNGRTEIANNIESFYIIDNYIYYTKNEGEYLSGIYRMTIDGKNEELIVDHSVRKFYIYGNCLYYIAGDNVLAQSNLNGDNENILKGDVNNFKILNDNNILYEDVVNSNCVYTLKSDGTSERMSGNNYVDKQLTVDSFIINKDYTLILPPDSSYFQYGAIKKNYLWTFISKTTGEFYYCIKGGNKVGDFEVIDGTICSINKYGECDYIDTNGSDFMNEDRLNELTN